MTDTAKLARLVNAAKASLADMLAFMPQCWDCHDELSDAIEEATGEASTNIHNAAHKKTKHVRRDDVGRDIQVYFKQCRERLAIALEAIGAAKELIADESWYVDELGEHCLGCCLNKKLNRHAGECPVIRFTEAVTKLEAAK